MRWWAALLRRWRRRPADPTCRLRVVRFGRLLEGLQRLLSVLDDARLKLQGGWILDRQYVVATAGRALETGRSLVFDAAVLSGGPDLPSHDEAAHQSLERLSGAVDGILAGIPPAEDTPVVLPLAQSSVWPRSVVGERLADLSRACVSLGLRMPEGVVITSRTLWELLDSPPLRGCVAEARQALARDGDVVSPDVAQALSRLGRTLLAEPLHARVGAAVGRELAGMASAAGCSSVSMFAGFAVEQVANPAGETPWAQRDVPIAEVEAAYLQMMARLVSQPAFLARCWSGRRSRLAPAVYCVCIPSPGGDDAAAAATRIWTHTVTVDEPDQMQLGVEDGSGVRTLRGNRLAAEPSVEGAGVQEARLAEVSLAVERYLGRPLQLHWTLDAAGEARLLWGEPVPVDAAQSVAPEALAAALRRHEVLLDDPAAPTVPGVGHGAVFRVDDEEDWQRVPFHAVVLARPGAATRAAQAALARAAALVAVPDAASAPLLTAALDLGVPALAGLGNAAARLSPGAPVTVDAQEGVVYEGIVRELVLHYLVQQGGERQEAEYHLLREVTDRLTEPVGGAGRSRASTLLDVAGSAHARAVAAMAALLEQSRGTPSAVAVEGAPARCDLTLVDLGSGIARSEGTADAESIAVSEIASEPLSLLIRGMGMATEPALPGKQGAAPAEHALRGLALASEERVTFCARKGDAQVVVDALLVADADSCRVYWGLLPNDGTREPAPWRQAHTALAGIVDAESLRLLAVGSEPRLHAMWVRTGSAQTTQRCVLALGRVLGQWSTAEMG